MNVRMRAFLQILEIGKQKSSGVLEYGLQHSQVVEERLNSVHSELEKILSFKDTPAANLQNSLKIVIYYREWEMNNQRQVKTKLKKSWIKAKRLAAAENQPPPDEPNYNCITAKNIYIEKMVSVFTELLRQVEDSMDMCEEVYLVDMQEVRSLVGAMYGAHVEGEASVGGEEW
jgi:hypothetical protein